MPRWTTFLLCVFLFLPTLLVGCGDGPGLRLLNFGRTALVTGDFDTVEQLLQEVANTTTVEAEIQVFNGYVDGPHFETENVSLPEQLTQQVEDLLRAETTEGLDQFKTAFLSCGMRGVSDHVYNGVAEDNHLIDDAAVVQHLVDAANHGVNTYFSDWTYEFIERGWPEKVEWLGDEAVLDSAQRGQAGPVNARIVNSGLAAFMELSVGDEIEIIFNQGGWAVALAVSEDVQVLVEGDIVYDDPDTGTYQTLINAPLVFTFQSGGGRVVYTAFHNEAQITDDARDVLRYSLEQLSSN
ncbi:MAG: hypothetical protein VX498_05635 [Myxococcota bacterium]|nr:hypothetical protein [Myxococcota bacterium]